MTDPQPSLTINNSQELAEHEADILARIRRLPNGGNLFMAHPFLLLADVGVVIGDELRTELQRRDRYLRGLSETPYRALKQSCERQRVRYDVRSLFRVEQS